MGLMTLFPRRRPGIWFGVALAFGCLVIGEAALRLAGGGDFPLYQASADYGYIPAPSQHGRFVGNDWAFNALSMGVMKEFDPSARRGVLLVGDSIVLCGNTCRQDDKLGPRLEKATGRPVWPISAGSWGLYNELRYLELHPEVVAAVGTVVLIVNPGDFDGVSIWRSEITHPTARPWSVLWYWASKKLAEVEAWRDLFGADEPPGLVTLSSATLRDYWRRVTLPIADRMVVVLYPDRRSMDDPASWAQTNETARSIMAGTGAKIVDIRPRWSADLFLDSIHPTHTKGLSLLTDIIARELEDGK